MNGYQRAVALILSFCFMLAIILPAWADEVDDARQRLNEINQQIDATQAGVNQATTKQRSIRGDINKIDKNIKDAESRITALNNKISSLQTSIKKTEQEIITQEKELNTQVDTLGNRLVYVYEKGGHVSYLEVLLASTSIKDFLTRYDMLSCIIQEDISMIDSINQKRKDLDMKKSDLEVRQQDLVASRAEEQVEKTGLDQQRSEKSLMLKDVEKEKDAYLRALEELEEDSREMQAIIRRSQSSGGQIGTGSYTWPTPGYTSITSPYGMRYHPILKVRKMHTGIDIGAPMSAKIVAADSGNVIYSGWMGAYGQAVVIDHGGGLSTMYAHQDRILVNVGDSVSKGQQIGKVGTTGWSTGAHLHFEVRINGEPTDPRAYI